jgi:molybdopterin-guanine dinucleotide biosynthesis protein A
MNDEPEWNAVILAGGRASRLGGIDKTALVHAGRTLLEHAMTAAAGAGHVVVVGPDPHLMAHSPRVTQVTESPRFSGPASALAAGVMALEAMWGAGRDDSSSVHSSDLDSAATDSSTADSGNAHGTSTSTDTTGTTTGATPTRGGAAWTVVLAADQPRVVQALPLVVHALRQNAGRDGVIAVDAGGNRQPLLAAYRTSALVAAVTRANLVLDGCSMRTLLAELDLEPVRLDATLLVDVDLPQQARALGIALPEVARVR